MLPWLVTFCFLTGDQRGELLALIAKSTVDKTDDKGSGHSFSLSLSPAQSLIPADDAGFLFPPGMSPTSAWGGGDLLETH